MAVTKNETATLALSDILMVPEDNIRAIDRKASRRGPSEYEMSVASIRDLRASIRKEGLLSSLVVREHNEAEAEESGKGYRLIAGFRRYEAMHDDAGAEISGLPKESFEVEGGGKERCVVVSCVVLADDSSPLQIETARIAENVNRDNLAPSELAEACHRLSGLGLAQGKIGDAVKISRPYVNNLLKLRNNLSPEMWAIFADPNSGATVRALCDTVANVEDHDDQMRRWEEYRAAKGGGKRGKGAGEGGTGGSGSGSNKNGPSRPSGKVAEVALQVARENLRDMKEGNFGDGEHTAESEARLVGIIAALAWMREAGKKCPVTLPKPKAKGKGKGKGKGKASK